MHFLFGLSRIYGVTSNCKAPYLTARKIPPISLTLTLTGQVSQIRRFIQAEVTIGRDPACECPVADEAVSARHARLSYHHNQWWLEDLEFNQWDGIQPGKTIHSHRSDFW